MPPARLMINDIFFAYSLHNISLGIINNDIRQVTSSPLLKATHHIIAS